MAGFTARAIMGALFIVPFLGLSAAAEVQTKKFEYQEGSLTLEGFAAWDDAKQGKRPAILIFPQYTGPSEHEWSTARELAKLGYFAMVADVYGVGVRPAGGKPAATEMAKLIEDRTLLRGRVKTALDRLLQEGQVDASKVATIGYCFGGAGVLELGRQGADVKAIVSLHGSLSNPKPADAQNIKGKVLVLHGADDPAVPVKEVEAFQAEMKAANVDMTFVAYSQTRHSFTITSAGSDNTKSSAYNPRSAQRAWVAMVDFLNETFAQKL